MENVGDWKITGSRDKVMPERLKVQSKLREQERQRLKEAGIDRKLPDDFLESVLWTGKARS
jgi:hypothetical protein